MGSKGNREKKKISSDFDKTMVQDKKNLEQQTVKIVKFGGVKKSFFQQLIQVQDIQKQEQKKEQK